LKSQSLFLQAFEGVNRNVPVWFMRQAGRYLPEYQDIKKSYTLEQMFRIPDVAAAITLLPVDLLKVDAAILFADILTLPSAMGFNIKFVDGQGPVIDNPIQKPEHIKLMREMAEVDYVKETIKAVNARLDPSVPLIGFAGGPFTVANYLVKGKATLGFQPAARFAMEHPAAFHDLMKRITANTIEYFNLQANAGIKAFQLFDSWAGVLRQADYEEFVLPYVQEIFRNVEVPSIYYLKNCQHLLGPMERSGADFLSVCETVTIGSNIALNNTQKGVQGNLYNGLLYREDAVLRQEVNKILTAARQHHQKYIFNLNHGIFPDIPVHKVKVVLDEVRKFKWA
jgi:uroporphyrinogen decarboxylase